MSKALHLAVVAKNEGMVKFLLWSGASVNARDSKGRTALHKACRTNVNMNRARYNKNDEHKYEERRRIIDMLLRSRAEINVQDIDGRTPLHEACYSEDESVVTALRRNGAKIGLVDKWGNTSLHEALAYRNDCDKKSSWVFALLAHNKAGGSKERSQLLTNGPADGDTLYAINVKGELGLTPLHLASIRNNRDIVCLLLHLGAEVGVKDDQGRTPLHCSIIHSSVDVVDVLVDNGEDIHVEDLNGDTPISLFSVMRSLSDKMNCQNGLKLLDYLLNVGNMVHRKSNYLKTAYEIITTKYRISYVFRGFEKTFIKHVLKLEVLNNQTLVDIKWKVDVHFYHSVKCQCYQELEDMKSTDIVTDVSLYEVLSRTNRPYPLSYDDILYIDEFLCSPDLLTRFPLYGLSLRTTFQRPKLLTLAVQSFYTEGRKQMVKELPCEVTEHLLTYLTNEDLRNFIRSESFERVNKCVISFSL